MKYVFLFFVLLCSSFAQDSFDPFQQVETSLNSFEQTEVAKEEKLVSESSFSSHKSLSQKEREFTLFVELDILNDWYLYWKNSGGISLPIEVVLESSNKDLKIKKLKYSTPDYHFTEPEYPSFTLEGKVYIAVTIESAKDLVADLSGAVKVLWQACKKDGQCIQGTSKLAFNIPLAEKSVAVDHSAKLQGVFPETNSSWTGSVRYEETQSKDGDLLYRAYVDLKSAEAMDLKAEDLVFLADFSGANLQTTKQVFSKIADGHFQTIYEGTEEKVLAFDGVLKTKGKAYSLAISLDDKPLPQGAKESELETGIETEAGKQGLIQILFIALLGGFILNLMPCVFPVVSLKVMGFVKQSQEGKGSAFAHALTFTAGVIVSFWIIAGATIAVKAGGSEVLWGAQLQNPYFMLAVCLVFLVLALSMFGLFEIGVSLTTAGSGAKKSGLTGSFFSGVLATVAATPCMAPFMGTAVAYAFSQSTAITFLVFTVMSIGMSVPYLLFAQFPSLLKVIPKPGPWMETFKQGLGFLLLAAVIYYTKTLQDLLSSDALNVVLFVYLLFALAAWVYGKYSLIYLAKSTRIKGLIATIVIVLVASFWAKSTISNDLQLQTLKGEELAEYQRKTGQIAWQKWSPEAVAKARAEGKAVFVDFTATWCLNCDTNKKLAINPNAGLFYEKGVVMFKADNTRNIPAITKAVQSYGSAGVPLNLLFKPGEDEPYKFPATYGKGHLTEQLETLK